MTEGYMRLAHLPFGETKSNPALATMVKNVGASKTTGLGVYSWCSSR